MYSQTFPGIGSGWSNLGGDIASVLWRWYILHSCTACLLSSLRSVRQMEHLMLCWYNGTRSDLPLENHDELGWSSCTCPMLGRHHPILVEPNTIHLPVLLGWNYFSIFPLRSVKSLMELNQESNNTMILCPSSWGIVSSWCQGRASAATFSITLLYSIT